MYRRLTYFFILITAICFLSGCSIGKFDKEIDKKNNKIKEEIDPLKEQIKEMTLDEKIGQMLIVGFEGYDVNENTRKLIENYFIGGVILYDNNIKNSSQLLDLINSLKTTNLKNKTPLFISVDEEGGRVTRIPKEFKKLPSNKLIGSINNKDFSYSIGSIIGEELKSFGYNMDFAPVLDINSNPKNPVIGDRSFGANEKVISELGVQTMKGIQSQGVIPVVKHFPGHGDTSVDSHLGLPVVNNDLNRLKTFELVPFKEVINNDADVVMIAHVLLPKIDQNNPSSLSKTIISDILRNQLDFNGVVVTDDMTMGAIAKNYNIGDAVVKSVNAGSDIILVAHGYDTEVAVINALKKAVEDKTISKERIDESVYRILKLKSKYNLNNDLIKSFDVDKINNRIRSTLNIYLNNR
ncbi:glycoside hydrolase family 3 [Clostridium polyendosporum]|uniref:beta-N-acetylhexosaminidase n=1 Tax=Clostridium polyendosporum TaxID=69208 RepID=A0A919RY06_9CLOT|nr:beta-N-acetylhexosaminidase [Clostridium polyendosporum]GIM28557.1 glycoside hydrolase family 3 [Clostridium polyendosporum]